jgi:Tol biopolymer transport system component
MSSVVHRPSAGRVAALGAAAALLIPLLALAGASAAQALAGAPAGTTVRVSVGNDGAEGDGDVNSAPAISADGRYVAFVSGATNLVPGGTSGRQVFVRDLVTGTTELVSVSTGGVAGNGVSGNPAISADGRHVAFASDATNLEAGRGNGVQTQVYVRDRVAGVTTFVSFGVDGQTDASSNVDFPSISGDGRFVAFATGGDLVNGKGNGINSDVYVRDMQAGMTKRVSVATDGTESDGFSTAPSLSVDGRFVAFDSDATNLVGGDTNARRDVFVHEISTGITERVSIGRDTSGQVVEGDANSSSPSISADGRYVAFTSGATNLVAGDAVLFPSRDDVFVHDRQTGVTQRVSAALDGGDADDRSQFPVMSGDGRYVAFLSRATDLVAGDMNGRADTFVHDRTTGVTVRVSVASDGTEGDDASEERPAISMTGQFAAFRSKATNLVPSDTNGRTDMFLHVVWTPEADSTDTTVAPSYVAPGGVLPLVSPGLGEWVQSDGSSTPLAVSSPGPNQVRYEADGVRVTFTGGAGSDASRGLVANPAGEVVCEICVELTAGGVIEAWMFSEPRLVAAWRIEDLPCQTFAIPVASPLDGGGPVSAGAHTLQLALPTASGMQAVNVGVTVGGPVPARVPAGEGPGVPAGLLLFGVAAAAFGLSRLTAGRGY